MNTDELRATVAERWASSVLPTLSEYTTIPCVSPAYDAQWSSGGHLVRAASLLAEWARSRRIDDLGVELTGAGPLTPLLVAEAPATVPDAPTVLIYGHLDKQPPLGAWRPGLAPFEPVLEDGRLYGRGTADDGYATFAAVTALEALGAAGAARPRTVVLIEASEESGSPDLPAHLERLGPRIGTPDLVLCLDSGCPTYDRLWTTASLRGNVTATVTVEVLTEGVHSGLAGGVVPSSFRLLRQLLSRLEDERTGEVLVDELRAEVPERNRRQLAEVAKALGSSERWPVVPGLRLAGSSPADRLVLQSWSTALAVTGLDGAPPIARAGNVLRPSTSAKLSFRLPPTCPSGPAAEAVRRVLLAEPPSGARVTVDLDEPCDGWVARDPSPWLAAALDDASNAFFGRRSGVCGEGGTIPFLGPLAAQYPSAEIVATGVLGPGSNAHGPNEFLHLATAEALTASVSVVLEASTRR